MALPEIDKPFVDRVFGALSQMEMELDADPLQHGPKRLSSKVAAARGMLTRCERIYLQIAHMLQQYRAANRAAQMDFDLGCEPCWLTIPKFGVGPMSVTEKPSQP